MIKELFKHAKSSLKYTIITPFIVALEVVIETMIPFLTKELVDNGVIKGDMVYVAIAGSILVVLALMGLSFGILSGWTATKGSTGFAKNLMDGMYANVQDFSFQNIDKFSTSSLITRLTTDVMNIRMAYQMTSRLSVRCPIQFTLAMVMTFISNVKIGLIFLAVVPILIVALIIIMKYVYPVFRKVFDSYDNMNRVVRENVNAVRVVKSFNTQEEEIKKFDETSNDIKKYFTRGERLISLNSPLMMLCIDSCIIMIAWFGGNMMITGEMSTGDLTMYISYAMQILTSLLMFSMVLVLTIMSRASAERIVEVLREEPTIKQPENAVIELNSGDIEFKDVNFSYSNNIERCALKDINLTIKSGEMVGVIGGTGSGKTTLIQLLPRLYDVTSGEVLIDGRDVREYDLKVLRDNVSVVLQKNVLFRGTLRENMQWGNENATDEQINEALEISSALDFVNNFKDGYDHYIEQGGANLSGGQKQRLCIARALLKNPKILILDDSTSAVDTKTDRSIKQGLRNTKPDITKIIIAQRISSVMDADKIIVIDNGRINGVGTHEELLANNQIYREVYESQNKGGQKNE